MKKSLIDKLRSAVSLWLTLVAALMLFVVPAGRASNPLVGCSYNGGGNWSVCGFYLPSYPGISLDSATLQLFTFTPGTYSMFLIARANAYNGPMLAVGSATVALDSSTTPVSFTFPSVRIPPGTLVCFELSISSGPAGFVYMGNSGCTDVVVTDDTTPPLSTFRRLGLALNLMGAQSLQVTNGWSIQAAINAASPGDTVTVGPGTYNEDLHLRSSVNVIGSGSSSTLLVGSGTNNVVTADGVTSSRFAGFTVTGATNTSGGYISGFYLSSSTVMVDNNRIRSNLLGATITLGSPILRNNIIESNGCAACSFYTVAVWCNKAAPLLANNVVASNFCGGLYLNTAGPTPQVINNTIVGNLGQGLDCEYGTAPIVKNNIITGNNYGVTAEGAGSAPALTYNDVWGNPPADYSASGGATAAAGPDSISSDPRFDFTSLTRFMLAPASPCIHAGDPNPLYNNPDGTRNTMGAYGGPSAMSPASGMEVTSGFLFTSVGIVPTALITNSGSLAGLANIPADVGAALYLPAWKDAPFGGQPYLYGLFGMSDTIVQYYQILGAPWQNNNNDPPAPGDFQPILDPLNKYKYVIEGDGTVQTTLVNVGPDVNGLYLRTDRADSGYWSAPDLKLVLNSYRLQNGRWDFICVAYSNANPTSVVSLPTNQLSRLTLWIDNNPVTVSITSVRDQTGTAILECGIINLATNTQDLEFEITAYHPTGFLDSYSLKSYYGRNHDGGVIASDQYVGSNDGSRPTWKGIGPATQIVHSQPAQIGGRLSPWMTCAYQFDLTATARTINGFNPIYWTEFNDHYYLTVGPSIPYCVADMNHDGRIDGLDLALFAAGYGLTNCPAGPH